MTHFDKSITISFFVFAIFGFSLSLFFDTSNKTITWFYKYIKIFDKLDKVFKFFISSFILLYSVRTLFKTNSS